MSLIKTSGFGTRFRVRSLVAGILTLVLVGLGVLWFQIQPNSATAAGLWVRAGEDVVTARAYLVGQIFGEGSITDDSTRKVETIDCDVTTDLYCGTFDNVRTVEALTVTMAYGMTSRVTILTPAHPQEFFTMYHHGHAAPSEYSADFAPTINALLSAGHTVAIIAMPFLPPNDHTLSVAGSTVSTHDELVELPRTAPSSELRFFLQPVFQTVDEFTARHPDWQIQLTGLSGGGWTTVVAAAIDTRIDRSVSIAGSTSFSSWGPRESIDYEQTLPGIAHRIDYVDLYVLMTHPQRSATLVYNTDDPCCFAPGDNPWVWDDAVTSLAGEVGGTLDVTYQSSNIHDIGSEGLKAILLISGE